jgi:enoyl-CoA hydratase/carnithine racemase
MDAVLVERDSELPGLVTITLNRPKQLNAINTAVHEELQAICHELKTDHEARVVILTGAGRAFSAGADLRQPPAPPAASALEQRVRSSIGNRTCDALDALPQVTIGAVNGLAVGGAVVFLSCMDMRLAAESAWFSIPEVELDIPLTWNALPRLIREIGPARTKELVMLCERFSSDDALRWGFVNHVHPDGALISEARRMAERLLSMDPLAIARTKAATSALAEAMVPPHATYSDPDLLMAGRLSGSPLNREGEDA